MKYKKSTIYVLLDVCIFSKSFAKTGTRKEPIPVINWISHDITSLFIWSRKVRNTTILRTSTAQLIIPIHWVETVCLFYSRCSERLDDACWFNVTSQSLLSVLSWVLGSYVPNSTHRQHNIYVKNCENFDFLELRTNHSNYRKNSMKSFI